MDPRPHLAHHLKTLLKAEDVSLSNLKNEISHIIHSASDRWLDSIARLCLREDTLKWYISLLDDRVTNTAQGSLTEYIHQLEERFDKSSFEARRESISHLILRGEGLASQRIRRTEGYLGMLLQEPNKNKEGPRILI